MLGGYLVWYIKILYFGSSYLELGLILELELKPSLKLDLVSKLKLKSKLDS
jgi:hypothetical protein